MSRGLFASPVVASPLGRDFGARLRHRFGRGGDGSRFAGAGFQPCKDISVEHQPWGKDFTLVLEHLLWAGTVSLGGDRDHGHVS